MSCWSEGASHSWSAMADEIERPTTSASFTGAHTMSPSPTPTIRWHQPVMAQEVLRYLNPRMGETIVDGTVGTGGHSLMILPKLLPSGKLVAVDRDRESLQLAGKRLTEFEPLAMCVHDPHPQVPVLETR